MVNNYAGDQWMPREARDTRMEDFWTWSKVDGTDADGDPISGLEHCDDSKKDL